MTLLINEQGFAFSLVYSIVSVEGGCWQARPARAGLPDGRPIRIDRAKLPPLGTCLAEAPADLVRDQYSDQLEESMVGEGSYVLSEGEPGTYPALTFSVEADTISTISGAEFQPAGE